jgi:splicing factor 1
LQGRIKEQLELERRKAIGEVVQLNPYFKPPTGWRPVYEEAKLFIPVSLLEL